MRWASRKAAGEHRTFVVQIEELAPWPALHGPLVVEYQRGSKKRGHSSAAESEDIGTGVTRYEWGSSSSDRFVIPSTLFAGKDGGLEQKLLNLYVCQVDEKGKPGNMVGGVVLDLAQLVGLPDEGEGVVRQGFPVECALSIMEMAGGRPELVIGLSQTGAGAGAPAPRAPSVASEGLPSRLSTEVPSSEQRMDAQEGSVATVMSPTRVEVAERGFKGDVVALVGGEGLQVDEDGFIVDDYDYDDDVEDFDSEIDEEIEGDEREPDPDPDPEPIAPSPTATTKNLAEEFRRASLDDENDGCENGDACAEHEEERDEGILEQEESVVPPLPAPDLTPFQTSKQKPRHERRFSRDVNTSFGSSMRECGSTGAGNRDRLGSPTFGSPRVGGATDSPSVASCGSAMKQAGASDDAEVKTQYRRELEVLAALEAAVWGAGFRRRADGNGNNPQLTSARRLARTVIALGEIDGAAFAVRAVRTIKVACSSSLGDVKRLVLWWSALVTLRVRFFTLAEEEIFGWLKSVSPTIAEAESELYAQIFDSVWDTHVGPALRLDDEPSDGNSAAAIDVRITSGLDAALDALDALSDTGVSILKTLNRLVLEDLAVKIDVALLKRHLASTAPVDSTTGLEIKVMVSQLTHYFTSRGACAESTPGSTATATANASAVLLPRMDSLSNVLVSHKAGLADPEVRKAIAPRISLNTILAILSRYTMEPEEGGREEFHKLLATLKTKASTTVDLNATYEVLDEVEYAPPSERTLSEQGIVQRLRLEMGEDSEDEIDDVLGEQRKGLLMELWGI